MNAREFQFRSVSLTAQVLAVIVVAGYSIISIAQSSSPILYGDDQSYSRELLRVRTLVRANVLDLAQSILETEGPQVLPNSEWLAWERQLWTLYRVRENWDALYQRTRQVPPAFPVSMRREAEVQAVHALIALDKGIRARKILRKHLLSSDISELEKRDFRKLIIESYLAEDLLNEASIAMKNYQLDYRSQDPDWLMLSAQVYLKIKNPDAAVNLLAPLDQPDARLLRIFARLENQSMTPQQGIAAAEKLLENIDTQSDRNRIKAHQVYSVIIYATQSGIDASPAVDALEHYLIESGSSDLQSDNVYPQFKASDLLDSYESVAIEEANKSGLLVGEHTKLFDHAIQLPENETIRKKAIYGYLLRNQGDPIFRVQLNDFFVSSLIASDRINLIPWLYGENNVLGKLELSGNVGMELSNYALGTGNIQLAAEANRGLTEPPQGMEQSEWLLHVARISIIAGDYGKGANDLMVWINGYEELQPDQTDQVLQPIFDLQTVNQHELALELLHAVNSRSHSNKHVREIAYWIAESYQASRQYIQAADYFLFSALQKDNGFDQWGESARFRAAESLLSANLVSDSRVLFEDLLARADDENRKLQLKQKLQELWLLESSLNPVESIQ
jgi:hypothetical protein